MSRIRYAAEEYDSPWKEALQRYLRDFLAFFFPVAHADIDWARGYEALDKEFQKIARKAKVGRRVADKLFKVWLTDGVEQWLLIHIEIQGDVEREFPERMLAYNLAARLLYNRTVVSLAVLCDERPDWRPASCGFGRWGFRTDITFGIAKLLDYGADLSALEASVNPFAQNLLHTKGSGACRIFQVLSASESAKDLSKDLSKDSSKDLSKDSNRGGRKACLRGSQQCWKRSLVLLL